MPDVSVPIGFVCQDPMWRVDFLAGRPHIPAVPLPTLTEAAERFAEPVIVLYRVTSTDDIEQAATTIVANPQLVVIALADDVSVEVLRAAMNAGLFSVVDAAADEATLAEALADADARAKLAGAQQQVGAAVAPTAGWLVVVTSAKGGQGASTVAVNLALTLHADPTKRVILVDGDMRFGDIGALLGFVQGEKVPFVPAALPKAPGWANEYIWRHEPSNLLTVLPPRIESTQDLPPEVAMKGLGVAQTLSDIVVVDLPFSGLEHTRVDTWADSILLVSTDHPRDLVNARIAARGFRETCEKSGLVISRYLDGRTPKRKTMTRDIGLEVYGRIPDQDDAARRIDEGRPVMLDDPDGPAGKAYRELAARLLDELASASTSAV